MCVCVCVCVYIYIYIHTHTHKFQEYKKNNFLYPKENVEYHLLYCVQKVQYFICKPLGLYVHYYITGVD